MRRQALRTLALLALAPLACERAPQPPARPNVLWIVWDTVRADRMSLYGHPTGTTPKLAAWAREARVFEDCVSPSSWTVPSHASMFTGLLPSEHGAGAERPWLDDRYETLAEILSREGYQTYLWSANPHVGAQDNLQQGFEREEHPWDPAWRERALGIVRAKIEGDRSSELPQMIRSGRVSSWGIKASGELAQQGLEGWLDGRDPGRPWFAFLNYMEAHRPYIPPRRLREALMRPDDVARSYRVDRSWLSLWRFTFGLRDYGEDALRITRGTYDATLLELDGLFAALTESLAASGDLENTIVVLTSDHGELLGEHHMLDHQYSLHRPLLNVPLVVWAPGRVEPGRERGPVSTLDLFATLLELTEVPAPPSARQDSLLRPVAGRTRLAEYPSAFPDAFDMVKRAHPGWDPSPWQRGLRALHDGDYKLIWGEDGRHELYDLGRDPAEEHDLVASEPELMRRLETRLDALLASLSLHGGSDTAAPALSEEERRRLAELGYLDEDASASP